LLPPSDPTSVQFNSLTFFAFMTLVYAGVWLLPTLRQRHVLLLIASYAFYGWWDWRFLFLILFSTVVAYVAGRLIAAAPRGSAERKRWLLCALALDLVTLGFFKYANFFLDSARELFGAWGFHPGTLAIILPVGISFFTFQTMSYTIDVYRGEIPPERDPIRWALFVSYFPQLVAGPILRARDFLPQLRRPIVLSRENFLIGGQRILEGLCKKVLIADRMALFVDPVFTNPALYSPATLWLALVAYAIQIYCDFAGYSDIAIGLGRTMGFNIMENFRMPYASTSITEFWRRWHISLSTWLRDYLYVPLGGNRHGRWKTYRNLMLVMLIGGLWHGAAWRFVVWGAIHGLALAVERALFRGRPAPHGLLVPIGRATGWIVTMTIVLIAWVFFRAPTFAAAVQYASGLVSATPGQVTWLFSPLLYVVLPLGIAAHIIGLLRYEARGLEPVFTAGRVSMPAVYLMLAGALALFAPGNTSPFVYFQF
jgi:alginate O-acetyltransferase complex protein AlgI